MKKLFGDAELEETRSSASQIKKPHELQLIARFRGQEIRDFRIRRPNVWQYRGKRYKQKEE